VSPDTLLRSEIEKIYALCGLFCTYVLLSKDAQQILKRLYKKLEVFFRFKK